MARKIDCFVAGVQKAGTTSLFALMSRHPGLSAPNVKELHVFDDETRDWEAPDHDDLERFYAADDAGLRFDGTPVYSYWPQSMERIARYNPAARIILMFREPVARAYSQWCMQYGREIEPLLFAEAIREGRARVRDAPADARERRLFSYVERGRYGSQLRRTRALFPDSQILALKAEDLLRDQPATLDQISAFLGIDAFAPLPATREHRRPEIRYPSAPSADDTALIHAELGEELRELADLTGGRIDYRVRQM